MRSYKARGIVLHTVKYGESSMVVFMLTDTFGRQNYLVQGIRAPKSKGNRAAVFQPMFLLEFVGIESPKMQMHRMKEVRMGMTLASVPFDVRKSTISLFMAEVLYRLVKEVEPQSPLFDFVCGSVGALDSITEGVANFHLWFLVRLSAHLGFYPGNEYAEGSVFDIEEGLFTSVAPTHRLVLNAGTSRTLSEFMSCGIQELACIRLSRSQRSDFMNSMMSYFGYHLDSIHNVRSIEILRDVF